MKVPVLLYHKIDSPTPDVKIRGAFTAPKRFARQLAYLKRAGFDFYTASEMAEHFLQTGQFPKRGIAITFDDGWEDNYVNAFPILKELQLKATIFLVPGCVGRYTNEVTAEGEGPRRHLSVDNIIEMSRAGIEMGSHSYNHKLLDQLDGDDIEAEMKLSKNYIEDLVQKPCSVFAYPAGFYTDEAKDLAKRSGYTAAFSTCYGPTAEIDPYAINRTEILRRDGYPFRFSRKLNRS